MAKVLDLTKSVHDLAEEYPEFIEAMVGLGFAEIAKPEALESVGRVMTVPKGARFKGIDLHDVVCALEERGFEVTGLGEQRGSGEAGEADKAGCPGAVTELGQPGGPRPEEAAAGTQGLLASDDAGQAAAQGRQHACGRCSDACADEGGAMPDAGAPGDGKAQAGSEAARSELLKSYVARLSAGEGLESVRRDFVANFEYVDAAEIARAEQSLIAAGAKVRDVQRLCDVHSALFHGATREERAGETAGAEPADADASAGAPGGRPLSHGDAHAQAAAGVSEAAALAAIPGHPVNVLARENEAIARQIAAARAALGTAREAAELARMRQAAVHYSKKGGLLYPVLDESHGFPGPSQVMWGVDDEIAASLRAAARHAAAEAGGAAGASEEAPTTGDAGAAGNHGAPGGGATPGSGTTPGDVGSPDIDGALAGWRQDALAALTRAEEMTYKEANILLPLCARLFTHDEWLRTYADMQGYDLCLIDEAGVWPEGEEFVERRRAQARAGLAPRARQAEGASDDGPRADGLGADEAPVKAGAGARAKAAREAPGKAGAAEEAPGPVLDGDVVLPTGRLTAAQLDALLNTLPFEVTFIDADDVNRYWNDDGEKKLFKRPSAALCRKVWSCHPPKAQDMARAVISSLKSGEKDSVDVWAEKGGEPVLVRYMAVRGRDGSYLGTMELVQRLGFAKEHFEKAGR